MASSWSESTLGELFGVVSLEQERRSVSTFADAATFEHERQKTEFPAHSTILESPEKEAKPLIEGIRAADQVCSISVDDELPYAIFSSSLLSSLELNDTSLSPLNAIQSTFGEWANQTNKPPVGGPRGVVAFL